MKRKNDTEIIKKISAKKKPIYENCSVYTIDNNLLFRCNRKKINWYLSKDLAEIIKPKGNEDIAIRLKFVAKGKSHSDTLWGTEDRENQCCVCGTTEHLNLHHVFPYVYRKWCPELIKSHTHHDILPLCTLCHANYEIHAQKLKTALVEMFDMPLENKGYIEYPDNRPIIKAANALKWHSEKIPNERKEFLFKTIQDFFDARKMSDSMTKEEMINQAMVLPTLERSKDFIEHGEYVIKQILAIPKKEDDSYDDSCQCHTHKDCPCQTEDAMDIKVSDTIDDDNTDSYPKNKRKKLCKCSCDNHSCNKNNTNIKSNSNKKDDEHQNTTTTITSSPSSSSMPSKITKSYAGQLPSPQSPQSPQKSSMKENEGKDKKKKDKKKPQKLELKNKNKNKNDGDDDDNDVEDDQYNEAELKHFSPSKTRNDDPDGSSIERDLEILNNYVNKCCGENCRCRCRRLPMPEQIIKAVYKPEGFKLLPIPEETLQKNSHHSKSSSPTKKSYISLIPEELYREANPRLVNVGGVDVDMDNISPSSLVSDPELPSPHSSTKNTNEEEGEEGEEEEKEKIKNAMLERFIKMWRKHFLKYTQPKFLSVSWQVSNSVYCD